IIETELQLKDLDGVERKLSRTEKMLKTGDIKVKLEYEVLVKCKAHLEKGKNILSLNLSKEEKAAIADSFLLTDKPVLYVANVDEASMHTGNKYSDKLVEAAMAENAQVIIMTNAIEAQIAEFENPEDKQMFMEEYKMEEPVLNR